MISELISFFFFSESREQTMNVSFPVPPNCSLLLNNTKCGLPLLNWNCNFKRHNNSFGIQNITSWNCILAASGCNPSTINLNCVNTGSDVNTTDMMTSQEPVKDPYEGFFEEAQLVTGLVLYPIICFFGIIANALTVIVMTHSKLRTSTNIYLTALALADLVKLFNDALYVLVSILFRVNPALGQKAFGYLYPTAHYVFSMSVCNTAWLTVSVTIERFIFVCFPAKAKEWCTITRAKRTSVAVFISMAVLAIPNALRYRTIDVIDKTTNQTTVDVVVTELWQNKVFSLTYTWVQNLLRSIIPLFVLVLLNYCIIQGLRRTRANRKIAARNKITLMLICIVVVFLICITPDAIMAFFGFGYYDSSYLIRGIREYTDTLLAFNSAVNFILYCIFNKIFRLNFMLLFCKRCYKDKKHSEVSQFGKLKFSQESSGRISCMIKGSTYIANGIDNLNGKALLSAEERETYV